MDFVDNQMQVKNIFKSKNWLEESRYFRVINLIDVFTQLQDLTMDSFLTHLSILHPYKDENGNLSLVYLEKSSLSLVVGSEESAIYFSFSINWDEKEYILDDLYVKSYDMGIAGKQEFIQLFYEIIQNSPLDINTESVIDDLSVNKVTMIRQDAVEYLQMIFAIFKYQNKSPSGCGGFIIAFVITLLTAIACYVLF